MAFAYAGQPARDEFGLGRRALTCVWLAAAALVAVDFLEGEDVGVEGVDGGGEPVGVDEPVGEGAAVQQVEGGQAHLDTLRRRGSLAGC